jgi:O-antigen/teichoic acid export membrane protein
MKLFFEKYLKGSTVTAKVVRGGAWLGAGSAGEYGLRFARNMIVARILAKEAFGLMAIVLSVCSLFQVLTGLWIKESVVQNPRGSEQTFLNGVWFLAMGRALLLMVAAYFLTPWIAQFYDAPQLVGLIRVAFFSVLFQGALSPRAYVAIKQMHYHKWVLVQQVGGILGVATTIVLAFYLKSVWALAIGYVAENVARCLLSYIVCPFMPRLHFEKRDMDSLFAFSKGMMGMPVLMLIYTEGSTFVTGKVCSKEFLGLFALTLSLARIPGMFGQMLVDLLLPSFSQMQQQDARLNHNLLKVTSLITFVAGPALVATALFGEEILTLVYGPAYARGAVALSLLFANEMMLTCNIPIASLFVARGQPALLRRFSLVRALLMVAIAYPAIKYFDIIGAAATPLLAMCLAYGLQLHALRKMTGLKAGEYLAAFMRAALLSIPPVFSWLVFKLVLHEPAKWVPIAWTIAVTAIFYGVLAVAILRNAALRNYFWPFQLKAKAVRPVMPPQVALAIED